MKKNKTEVNFQELVSKLLETRTQWELANLIGVQQSTVWRWKDGISEPKGATRMALLALAERAGM